MNKERQLQKQQINQTTQEKRFLIVGMLIFLILSMAILRIYILKRRNETNRRIIAEKELQLQKLASEKTKVEMQQQSTELEMQALRAQMNPHFIFNCLSSINRFILINESESASDYLTKFSRLIRMVLNNSQEEAIPLEEELEMLRLYLDMEKLRLKHAFEYHISICENFDPASFSIPPLLLQPFVENAIWHGLMNKEGHGLIEIALQVKNNNLTCTITDNGIGRMRAINLKSESGTKQKSIGMQITSKRLELLNRHLERAYFEIEDLVDEKGDASGTRVTLSLQNITAYNG